MKMASLGCPNLTERAEERIAQLIIYSLYVQAPLFGICPSLYLHLDENTTIHFEVVIIRLGVLES